MSCEKLTRNRMDISAQVLLAITVYQRPQLGMVPLGVGCAAILLQSGIQPGSHGDGR